MTLLLIIGIVIYIVKNKRNNEERLSIDLCKYISNT